MGETRVWSLGQEDLLEREMAIHSSTLAWKISWTESLVDCSPWSRKESDTTEQLHFTSPSCWAFSFALGLGISPHICSTAYHLTGVSLTLDVGYLLTANPAKHSHRSWPWMWGISSRLLQQNTATSPDLGRGVVPLRSLPLQHHNCNGSSVQKKFTI